MTLTSPSVAKRTAANLVFQMEVMTNSDGAREICHIECDPTNDEASRDLQARELGAGAWEFTFRLPAAFDRMDPIFEKFRRYALAPEDVVEACRDALP